MKIQTAYLAVGASILLAALYVLFHHSFEFTLAQAAFTCLSFVLPLFFIGKAAFNSHRYFRPTRNLGLIFLAIPTVFGWVYASLHHSILTNWLEAYSSNSYLYSGWITEVFIAVVGLMSAFIMGWYHYNLRAQELIFEKQKEIQNLSREAEWSLLRHQLQPHFLFISLNSINALGGGQPERAREMIAALADFLRENIQADQKSLKEFGSELEQIDKYLSIEKVRFGNRLQVKFDIDEATRKTLLPPLILQPVSYTPLTLPTI